MSGMCKRLTVKEHCDRVRFDPTLIEKHVKDNKFRLIYPKTGGNSQDGDDYEKF